MTFLKISLERYVEVEYVSGWEAERRLNHVMRREGDSGIWSEDPDSVLLSLIKLASDWSVTHNPGL